MVLLLNLRKGDLSEFGEKEKGISISYLSFTGDLILVPFMSQIDPIVIVKTQPICLLLDHFVTK